MSGAVNAPGNASARRNIADHDTAEAERIHELADVLDVLLGGVLAIIRPAPVAVPPVVQSENGRRSPRSTSHSHCNP
jgi:hypothetical protein